jgi:hypothetical protein
MACLTAFSVVGLTPIPQLFQQEIAANVSGLGPPGAASLLDRAPNGAVRAYSGNQWWEYRDRSWQKLTGFSADKEGKLTLPDPSGKPFALPFGSTEVLQVFRKGNRLWVCRDHAVDEIVNGTTRSLGWPEASRIFQIAVDWSGTVWAASSAGLFRLQSAGWMSEKVSDGLGRYWAVDDVRGVAVDSLDRLWFATKAGVGCRTSTGWQFYEGRDGLPWNDFTGIFAGPRGEVWFGTHLGAIRFDGSDWHYRQGPLWLPGDNVRAGVVGGDGTAAFLTDGGLGLIEFRPMALAAKAAVYEEEIARYIKRTPFGYVAGAPLGKRADRSSAQPVDDDNDGLWTAMYGAGECFSFAATGDPQARIRARQAFEALRFLQDVTQGGEHPAPKGFIARSVRASDLPDPNPLGEDEDQRLKNEDQLWKSYQPRWPKSADGKWYWKSDTSSDELDGHLFFYPLYFDLCADSDAEKERVREVVRNLADHFLSHDFNLIDHDGRPTRWGVFGPKTLNSSPSWWAERGLNSLSILTYLTVATHVTGDPKYEAAAQQLITAHGYGQNIMFPKVQFGPGSGNHSDDEMAFMCYYSLLRYSKNDALKAQVRHSFFNYWCQEAPELNPFFNFTYASQSLDGKVTTAWGSFSVSPWGDWLEDSRATLYGFPLDRLNWPHRNSHRLDLIRLPRQAGRDLESPDKIPRGRRVNGKVLPVENRQFDHWNTDPWELDYGGNADHLSAGTVFLLPYYMGLYHGYVEKP